MPEVKPGRGMYVMDKAHGYQTAYDDAVNLPRGDTSTAEAWWTYYVARPWLSGGFAWSGFDYRGENDWPDVNSNYGILDTAGFPKDVYYYYQSRWSDKPVLHILTCCCRAFVACTANCGRVCMVREGEFRYHARCEIVRGAC